MKTIHEIIRINGGLRKLRENKIRIEKESISSLEIELIGEGPRGFEAIKVSQIVCKGGDWHLNPEFCFEMIRLVNWKYSEEGMKPERIVYFFPYSYTQDISQSSENVFEIDVNGEIKDTNQNLISKLDSLRDTWNRDFKDSGYLEIFKSQIEINGAGK
ncbi:DUF6908 domain-containing protein [Leptospira kmetyi]|uniref:DUF6908 domain-containing protein n=1 Tax=Leptospira kmetyi TaxID=408139 RepID=A0ABX4N602_9LEPT|nr:hypothetical protein [Leptospira kmetyi]PJZ28734.1 hypothetical protein CH378_16165 [Leptospira kmetyi]PJZ39560.1 hypothetical protein CH370_21150 [Leptospira kmetyi]